MTTVHPPEATHMVSFPDWEPDNNALGYCSSSAQNPNLTITLTPIGKAWERWALAGTNVIVKWLKLPGSPEYLHVLDGETSTSMRLPRRLRQRSAMDVVRVKTSLSTHFGVRTVLYYGKTAAFANEAITVTPLGKWLYAVPMGGTVEIINLSDPGNGVKSGVFGAQSTIEKNSIAAAKFFKDVPGA